MVALKLLIATILLVAVNCRSLSRARPLIVKHPSALYMDDSGNIIDVDFEDLLIEKTLESVHPKQFDHSRTRREIGDLTLNSDLTADVHLKVPLTDNKDKPTLSAIGSANNIQGLTKAGSLTGGVLYETPKYNAMVAATHINSFGEQLTASGRLKIMNDNNHKLNVDAFITKNLPKAPEIPTFNSKGVGLDYMYKDKVGANLGMVHHDFFKQNDYSAIGKLNLFQSPTSSLNFYTGVTKSVNPYMSTPWQPTTGFSFTRSF